MLMNSVNDLSSDCKTNLSAAESSGDRPRSLAHVGRRHEPGTLRRRDEGAACSANGDHAVHGCFHLLEGAITGMVGDRPLLLQPVVGLFGGGDLLDVTVGRHDKGQGLAPVYFDQRLFFREDASSSAS